MLTRHQDQAIAQKYVDYKDSTQEGSDLQRGWNFQKHMSRKQQALHPKGYPSAYFCVYHFNKLILSFCVWGFAFEFRAGFLPLEPHL
jgi:hypothetical protein